MQTLTDLSDPLTFGEESGHRKALTSEKCWNVKMRSMLSFNNRLMFLSSKQKWDSVEREKHLCCGLICAKIVLLMWHLYFCSWQLAPTSINSYRTGNFSSESYLPTMMTQGWGMKYIQWEEGWWVTVRLHITTMRLESKDYTWHALDFKTCTTNKTHKDRMDLFSFLTWNKTEQHWYTI